MGVVHLLFGFFMVMTVGVVPIAMAIEGNWLFFFMYTPMIVVISCAWVANETQFRRFFGALTLICNDCGTSKTEDGTPSDARSRICSVCYASTDRIVLLKAKYVGAGWRSTLGNIALFF